jgi:hypothetical protein
MVHKSVFIVYQSDGARGASGSDDLRLDVFAST